MSITKLDWLLNKKIAVIGDSITADKRSNYVTLLTHLVSKTIDINNIEVVNYGVDSYSICDALDLIPDILVNDNPDLFIIFIGVNDSKIFKYIDKPLISTEIFMENYETLLRRIDLSKNKKYKLLLTLPPLLFNEIKNGPILRDYWYWDPRLYLEYNQKIKKLGENFNCTIVDIYKAFQSKNKDRKRLFYEDGVHPNIYGHQIIARAIFSALKELDKTK